ncbi:MAG: radical SAM/SPASM domain-containing protein [Burkholderiales bacterium]
MGHVDITQRLDAVRELPGSARSSRPPVPKSAKLELTSHCDLDCYFCASHQRPRRQADMEWTLFTRLAGELRDAGVEQLGLFYIGESFLCEWLPEAVRYAKQACGYPYVFLTTNGVAATRDRVEACMAAGLDSLKFAFNWSDARQFERVAGANAAEYEHVVENAKAARSARDHVEHETGHRCSLYASSVCYDEVQSERMQEILQSIKRFVDHHYWLPLFGQWGLPGPRLAGRPVPVKPLPCWALFTEAHITWDGKLSACSLDASQRFHVADLTQTTFAEGWASPAFQELRKHHLAGSVKDTACHHCLAY